MTKSKRKKKSKVFETLRIIKNTFFAVILVFLVGVLILTMFSRISGNAPSFFGYSIYRVSSGSMEPVLKVGDIILSRQIDPTQLAKNDIVTFRGTTGEFDGKIVTHRVVVPPYDEGGSYYLITQGDANPEKMDTPISTDQVLGKFERKLSAITVFYNFFITPWGLVALFALIILAFFNEIIILIRTIFHMDEVEAATDGVGEIVERYRKENEEAEARQQAELEAARQSDAQLFSSMYDEVEGISDDSPNRADESDETQAAEDESVDTQTEEQSTISEE